jgi:hypothetical protein
VCVCECVCMARHEKNCASRFMHIHMYTQAHIHTLIYTFKVMVCNFVIEKDGVEIVHVEPPFLAGDCYACVCVCVCVCVWLYK